MQTIYISTADDSDKKYTCSFEVEGTNMTWVDPYNHRGYHWGRGYEMNNVIRPSHYRNKNEPTIAGIKYYLNNYLAWGKKGRPNFSGQFIIHKGANQARIHCAKTNNKYMIQGMVTNKDTALTALARTIYRSCFDSDVDALEKYCFNHILLPENVSYALENRAPYHWYLKGKKIEVRFNVKMIGPDECAMEISDGIWAPISVKRMNTYMNYYWKGQKSSSWFKARLTPKKLWKRLLGDEPSIAQENMMIAFLQQNRTDELVQKRAYQLVKDMAEQYKDRLKVFWDNETVKAILVRGKLADWVITDNQFKSEIQAVSTFVYQNTTEEAYDRGMKFNDGNLKGPICIDNMQKNSSVGDQFAARAFALLNDKMTVEIVSTIKHYLTDDHYDGQTHNRLHFPNITRNDLEGFY
tara:strand:+ start:586 stop:1812 length:1227 start_codon:yes stop_codon:yes gene_type:complete